MRGKRSEAVRHADEACHGRRFHPDASRPFACKRFLASNLILEPASDGNSHERAMELSLSSNLTRKSSQLVAAKSTG